jgi:hypothetical protein
MIQTSEAPYQSGPHRAGSFALKNATAAGLNSPVEGGAVEARGVAADVRHHGGERGVARRQEREVAGIRHHVMFGLCARP